MACRSAAEFRQFCLCVAFDKQRHEVPYRPAIELGVHVVNDVRDHLRRHRRVLAGESLDDLPNGRLFALLRDCFVGHSVSVTHPSSARHPPGMTGRFFRRGREPAHRADCTRPPVPARTSPPRTRSATAAQARHAAHQQPPRRNVATCGRAQRSGGRTIQGPTVIGCVSRLWSCCTR
jgi:hypothetical protein